VVTRAIKDVLGDKKPQLTQDEMQKVMETFQQKQMEKQMAAGDKNEKAGQDFLAANKKKEGVTETASGLQYKVVKPGSGDKAKATDTVVVHYKGTLINGTEFDSSYKRNEPATFPVNRVIPGWTEALQLMNVGSKYQLAIPSKLAYGQRGAGGAIGPNETLLFDVELIEIKK
jgi:FKBP-type peptidyl-prolyl cis-trans isomerase FklB